MSGVRDDLSTNKDHYSQQANQWYETQDRNLQHGKSKDTNLHGGQTKAVITDNTKDHALGNQGSMKGLKLETGKQGDKPQGRF